MDAVARARRSLEGLSVGDGFGERFFGPAARVYPAIQAHELPPAPWRWTDDTEMAVSVVEVLVRHGRVDQDALAAAFAARFDVHRGYGQAAADILQQIRDGTPWGAASRAAFRGRGSFGNGAAMRVAPLGAFFAEDLERCAREAVASAEITHSHEEGIAGAVAVAIAAALAWRHRDMPLPADRFLAEVAIRTPPGYTRDGIEEARGLLAADVVAAATALGNGTGVTAPDTVPLCLWVASRRPGEYEPALWETVAALGDRDTTCAIVGGILAAGSATIPADWLARREPLPPIGS